MPEAPDLYVLREFLATRIVGSEITGAAELRPLVIRNLTDSKLVDDVIGRSIIGIGRKGKLLILNMSGDVSIIVSPMLAGELRLVASSERMLKSTIMTLDLGNSSQLRYIDSKRMGQIYYVSSNRVSDVSRLEDQGPDVFDEPCGLEEFKVAMRTFRGEVKGVLTRGQLVAGIGNAYADEILWDAGIYPFKKVGRLSDSEIVQLHKSVYSVPIAAVKMLEDTFLGDDRGPRKERNFLSVHGKSGKSCLRCGSKISSIKARRRETNFCRSCQPGSMFS